MDRPLDKKIWTLRRIGMIGIPSIIISFLFLNTLLGDHRSKLNVETDRLTISTIVKAPFQEFIPITGIIEPFQTFYLDLNEGGRVIKKYIDEGAIVNIGDPIVKLDNPNLSLQVMSTQSSFMLAESQLKQTQLTFEQNALMKESQLLDIDMALLTTKRTYEVSKALYSKGMESATAFESNKVEYECLLKKHDLMMEVLKKDSLTNVQLIEESKKNVEQTKSYLNLVSNQLDNLTVRAPIKGQLTSLVAEIGQAVGPGYKLGRIDNTDSYKIRAEIDEHYISRVHDGLFGDFEFAGKNYSLMVKTVYPQVSNGRFFIDLIFLGTQPEGLRRGQTMQVKLQLGDLSDVLLIANGGFFSTTGGQWIFVVDQSGSFAEKRPIKIGRQNPQFYEVLEGLKSGEKVITSSYENYGDIEKLILK